MIIVVVDLTSACALANTAVLERLQLQEHSTRAVRMIPKLILSGIHDFTPIETEELVKEVLMGTVRPDMRLPKYCKPAGHIAAAVFAPLQPTVTMFSSTSDSSIAPSIFLPIVPSIDQSIIASIVPLVRSAESMIVPFTSIVNSIDSTSVADSVELSSRSSMSSPASDCLSIDSTLPLRHAKRKRLRSIVPNDDSSVGDDTIVDRDDQSVTSSDDRIAPLQPTGANVESSQSLMTLSNIATAVCPLHDNADIVTEQMSLATHSQHNQSSNDVDVEVDADVLATDEQWDPSLLCDTSRRCSVRIQKLMLENEHLRQQLKVSRSPHR